MIIYNEHGVMIDFDAAANLMDDEIVEHLALHDEIDSEQEFFDRYCELHLDKFGEEFELVKPCPQY